jgi:heptosyltransferase-2
VVAPNWIGDALMAQPLLALLRRRQPGTRIEVLAPPWVAPVLRRMPGVDEVIEADLRHGRLQLGERWRLGRRLRARGYSDAYVLPNTLKSALVPFFAGIPARHGHLGEARRGLINRVARGPDGGREPMALHYARLSGEPDLASLPPPTLAADAEKTRAAMARFGLAGDYAVFCPGAEYGPAKRWPYFAELSRRVDTAVVALGSAADRDSAQQIKGKILAGETTLDEAMDLIAGARYVVTNDSGLMHVAAALGRPQVALFGSSSPEHTPPQSPAAKVLWLRAECSPCFQRECPLGHFKCMRELSVAQVLAEIRTLQ